MSFAHDLAAKYIADGLITALQVGTSSKASADEETPLIVRIIPYGGASPERTHNQISPPAYLRPRVQVSVLGLHAGNAHALARALLLASIVRSAEVNGTYYREIDPIQSEPTDNGMDGKRLKLTFNVSAVKRSSN